MPPSPTIELVVDTVTDMKIYTGKLPAIRLAVFCVAVALGAAAQAKSGSSGNTVHKPSKADNRNSVLPGNVRR
jgi:hypothetical protein